MRRLILGAVTLGALSIGSLAAPAAATGKFRVVSFTAYFPLTTAGPTPFTAQDVLVPGSGTGDLAGSSQVGPATYRYDPATNTTTGSGSIRCRVG
jgi:hypothetical protein